MKAKRTCHTPWKKPMTGQEVSEYMREMEFRHKKSHIPRRPIEPYKCATCGHWHVAGRQGRRHF